MSPRTCTHIFEGFNLSERARAKYRPRDFALDPAHGHWVQRSAPAAPRLAVRISNHPERHRQQRFQISRDRFPTIANTNNRRLAAKFREHLPTRTARSNRLRSRSVEHQRSYLRMPIRNRLKDRVPLRTNREPIRSVLNIASANNFPIASKHCRPHPKLTVRTIRKRTRLARCNTHRRKLVSRDSRNVNETRRTFAFGGPRLTGGTLDSSHRHSSS
jgi:hypothetical protein